MIDRKWPIARAEVYDPDNGWTWVAESRAGTGTWVVRDSAENMEDDGLGRCYGASRLVGGFFGFTEDNYSMLEMTPAQMADLGMTERCRATLAARLEVSFEQYKRTRAERQHWTHEVEPCTVLARLRPTQPGRWRGHDSREPKETA